MIFIPKKETKTVTQLNRSKILGDLWSSFNLDLMSDLGVIKVSPRMKLAESSALSNFGLPVAFRHFDNRIFTIAGTRVFKTGAGGLPSSTNYTEDASSGAKTTYDPLYSDMELFNGQLFTTTNDELMRKAPDAGGTGAWTEVDSAFASETTPHHLCYFSKFDRLYYNDGELIQSINTSYTVAASGDYTIDLELEEEEIITCIEATQNAIFIGTIRYGNTQGNCRGSVYEWDGISNQITAQYILDSQGALAMVIKGQIPHIIDARGALLKHTGYDFIELGRLPRGNVLPYNINVDNNNRWIHPNGFTVTDDDTFLVLANNLLGDNSGSILENMPSGVWEFSERSGFVHKYSLTYTESSTITDYGQNRLAAVGALVNMNLYSTSSSRNGQILCGATYYTDGSTTATGAFYNDSNNTLAKAGYFVSTWGLSPQLKDTWSNITLRFRELLSATDKIVLKYRTREESPVYIDITWNDTTSFHTSTDIDDYVGYEVEILQGVGSGKTFHISSVSSSAPWRANLDSSLTGATGTAKARLQNWKKLTTISSQSIESNSSSIGTSSERIQVKCYAEFTGEDEIYELGIINKSHTPLN